MEKLEICKGLKISKKIFTKTWQELEKFFGVSITQIGEVWDKKTKGIKEQTDLLFIIVCQDNDITREEMIKLIDDDPDPNISVFTVMARAVVIFPSAGEGGEPGESGKKKIKP